MRLLSVSINRPSDPYHGNNGAMPDWRSDKSPHKPVLWTSFWEFCQKNKELHLFKGASKLFVFVHNNIILICSIYLKFPTLFSLKLVYWECISAGIYILFLMIVLTDRILNINLFKQLEIIDISNSKTACCVPLWKTLILRCLVELF